MSNGNLMKFHSDRAMAELDAALSATSHFAAERHFALSSLHLEKIRGLRHRWDDIPAALRAELGFAAG